MKKIFGLALVLVVLATAFSGCIGTEKEEKCTVTVRVHNKALYTQDITIQVYDETGHTHYFGYDTTVNVGGGGAVGTVTLELGAGETRKIVATSEGGDTDSETIDCVAGLSYTVDLYVYY